MPIARVQMPDGRIARLEVPEGTAPEQVTAFLEQQTQAPQKRTLDDYKAMSQPTAPVDVAGEMSGPERFAAGMGMGMARLGRGIGQAVGAVDQSEIDRARELEAPLEQTGAGAAGNVAGTVAGLVPLAFVPGANTLGGAALIGAGSGALTTEGGLKERAAGAGFGAVGGAGGVALGRGLASGSRALGQRAAAAGTANAVTNRTIREAVESGRVLPPSEMAQSGVGRFTARMAEAVGGKEAMGQAASIRNQAVTNNAIRKQFNIPGKGQIDEAEIDALKRPLIETYKEAEKISPDAAEAVKNWRLANDDLRAARKDYARNSRLETKREIERLIGEADGWMGFVESEAVKSGKAGLATKLKEARVQLGKIGTLENALIESTGDVSALSLKRAMERGVPLDGEMRSAARFAQARGRYAQDPKTTVQPGVSKLDAVGAALTAAATGRVRDLAFLGVPYVTRNALLSRPVQAMARPSANPGATRNALANALERERALAVAGVSGNALSRR